MTPKWQFYHFVKFLKKIMFINQTRYIFSSVQQNTKVQNFLGVFDLKVKKSISAGIEPSTSGSKNFLAPISEKIIFLGSGDFSDTENNILFENMDLERGAAFKGLKNFWLDFHEKLDFRWKKFKFSVKNREFHDVRFPFVWFPFVRFPFVWFPFVRFPFVRFPFV